MAPGSHLDQAGHAHGSQGRRRLRGLGCALGHERRSSGAERGGVGHRRLRLGLRGGRLWLRLRNGRNDSDRRSLRV
jgi:hypothetical protein